PISYPKGMEGFLAQQGVLLSSQLSLAHAACRARDRTRFFLSRPAFLLPAPGRLHCPDVGAGRGWSPEGENGSGIARSALAGSNSDLSLACGRDSSRGAWRIGDSRCGLTSLVADRQRIVEP